jgi:hypothetical protein
VQVHGSRFSRAEIDLTDGGFERAGDDGVLAGRQVVDLIMAVRAGNRLSTGCPFPSLTVTVASGSACPPGPDTVPYNVAANWASPPTTKLRTAPKPFTVTRAASGRKPGAVTISMYVPGRRSLTV